MIYRKEEYIEESEAEGRFPVKQIEVLDPVGGGAKKFVGYLTLGFQTPMGVQQIPLSFEIEAGTIEDAFSKFEQYAETKIEEARKGIEDEIRKLRDEAATRIVRPGEVGLGGPGGAIDLSKLKR
ncbi:MAG: hypothetical protein V2A58_00415 [Planctomycetota bacterium]